MTKRFITILIALALMTVMFVPAVLAEDDSPAAGEGYYYVYTENGKGLNVRDMPRGNVVGSLKYGSRIYVQCNVDENWALITYRYNMPGYGIGDYACYVNRRFLTKKKPAARSSSSSSSSTSSSNGTISEINEQFLSATDVKAYSVTVRPARVSGWVNMRWAPSNEAEILATYKANDTLLVIKELKDWLQVEDQDTGNVGFISKQYVTQ